MAEHHLIQALDILRPLKLQQSWIFALSFLCDVRIGQGAYQAAENILQEASLTYQSNSKFYLCSHLLKLSAVYYSLKKYDLVNKI